MRNLPLGIILAFTTTASAQVEFAPPVQYEDDRWPFDVRGADFDSDGDVDLAVTLRGANLIRVLWNSGDGSFQTSSYLPTDVQPTNLTLADLDGDEDVDIVNANFASSTVTIWINDGNGVFVAGSTVDVGSLPHQVSMVDLDNDGDLDLLCANAGSGSVTRLLNDGSGQFSSSAEYSTGGQPHRFIVADIDGDGDSDVAVMEFLNGRVLIFENDGSANLTQVQEITLGHQSFRIEAVDIDVDGDIDLLPSEALLQNDGAGFFTMLPYPPPIPGDLGDVNCDGSIDGLSGQGDGTLLILESMGPTGPDNTSVHTLSAGVREAQFIDVNGDGYPDVVAAVGPWLGGEGGIIDVAMNRSSPSCRADITRNGTVDLADLLLVIGLWGICDGEGDFECVADTNGDNIVDLADLLLVISNWGSACQ